jgi:hypothetical protein
VLISRTRGLCLLTSIVFFCKNYKVLLLSPLLIQLTLVTCIVPSLICCSLDCFLLMPGDSIASYGFCFSSLSPVRQLGDSRPPPPASYAGWPGLRRSLRQVFVGCFTIKLFGYLYSDLIWAQLHTCLLTSIFFLKKIKMCFYLVRLWFNWPW